jgi:hypothetical protein
METSTAKQAQTKESTTYGHKENKTDKSFESVKEFSHKGKAKISKRLEELDSEMDIERLIHMHVSGISITGALLGFFVDKRWFILPAIAAIILALHSLKGLAPQVSLLKRLGFRLRDEINRERYSLKAMRGDFKNTDSADAVWKAAE